MLRILRFLKRLIKLILFPPPVKKLYYRITQANNSKLIKNLGTKVKNKEKIRVAFLVVHDSVFPAAPLFERMTEDDLFEPFIVVIPDVIRGEENKNYQLKKTYDYLCNKYKNVYNSYDEKTNSFIDFKNRMDMVCPVYPYDDLLTHKYYCVKYLKNKVLSFNVNYSYRGRTNFEYFIVKLDAYNFMWKIFIENKITLERFKEVQPIKGANLVLTGYCKMDDLAEVNKIPRTRKRIIIAPHHSVYKPKPKRVVCISQFLNYADFFLELPKLYPEIDFIFRPHQLLFATLSLKNFWGKEKTEKYFSDISANPNVIYSKGGEYFDLLINSDAMIHDCGSFLAEYFYAGKPQCYLLEGEEEIDREFQDFGKLMLKHTYNAFSKENVIDFIDNVVIKGEDEMEDARKSFADNVIKVNYPNVSQIILDYIKKELNAV